MFWMLLHAESQESIIHNFLTKINPFTCCVIPLSFSSLLSSHPSGPHGFQERLAASQEAMKNKNVVNLGAIRQGMKRFQFLLNCCEPGTIPDASILAAALDLVRFSLKNDMNKLQLSCFIIPCLRTFRRLLLWRGLPFSLNVPDLCTAVTVATGQSG